MPSSTHRVQLNNSEQIDEFGRFNAPSSNHLLPDYSTRQRQPDFELRSSPHSNDSHTSGLAWGSEFSSLDFDINRAPVSQPYTYRSNVQNAHNIQRQPRKSKAAGGPQTNSNHHTLYDTAHAFPSTTTNSWQFRPDIGVGMNLSTRFPAPTEQKQSPAISLEQTMEDFDWEALFASLDTTTRAKEGHADLTSSTLQESSTGPTTLIDAEIACPKPESIEDQIPDVVPSNKSLSHSRDAFERGMRIVHQDDNLSLAVLAFEEACRADPMHFEAWKMLGSVLAEVEREAEAILAFKEALKLETNNLDILMRLAVSYTNEGSHDLACGCLEQWMRIKYPQVSIPELESQISLPHHSELFERIKEPFIQAARLSLEEENIDPDVQVGLGLLMFSARLYEMAADCFHAAIQSTEPGTIGHQAQQHLLWNRYAACLGNIRDKEHMAVQAYETALALKPNFVKARCNLGVLYHNINQPLLGAMNTLEALVWNRAVDSAPIHKTNKILKSGSDEMTEEAIDYDETTEMYETLMKCCSSMCRWDLAELVGPNMDFGSFKKELDRC